MLRRPKGLVQGYTVLQLGLKPSSSWHQMLCWQRRMRRDCSGSRCKSTRPSRVTDEELTLMKIHSPCQALDELVVLMRRPPGYTATCCRWSALAIGYVAPR